MVAVILTLLVLKPDIGNIGAFLPTWPLVFGRFGRLAAASVFVIMGKSVETSRYRQIRRGAAFVAVFAGICRLDAVFGEKLGKGKLIGLCLAFTAVLPALETRRRQKSNSTWRRATLLLGVWSGLRHYRHPVQTACQSSTAFSGNLLVAFVLAGVLMLPACCQIGQMAR